MGVENLAGTLYLDSNKCLCVEISTFLTPPRPSPSTGRGLRFLPRQRGRLGGGISKNQRKDTY